jgi:hypothetical protein
MKTKIIKFIYKGKYSFAIKQINTGKNYLHSKKNHSKASPVIIFGACLVGLSTNRRAYLPEFCCLTCMPLF